MANSYTRVMDNIWQCNDCGAHAATKEQVKHHDTCKPGESQKWEEFYGEEDDTSYREAAAMLQEADTLGMYKPPVLMRSLGAALWQSDVDVLSGNINRSVRINPDEDAEVKRLYQIYKSL